MSKGGFVILFKSILDWEWYDDINTKTLFIHLLLRANFEDTTWRGIDIKRGELVSSFNNLATETGLTIKKVRTSLKKLESTGEVKLTPTNNYTIIALSNYSKFQSSKKETSKPVAKDDKPKPDNPLITQIVLYLNKVSGKNFSDKSDLARRHIGARINEGYTFEQFKAVIDSKCDEWDTPQMKKYIRPETLFGTKFDSYLNEVPIETTKNDEDSFSSIMREQIKRGEF